MPGYEARSSSVGTMEVKVETPTLFAGIVNRLLPVGISSCVGPRDEVNLAVQPILVNRRHAMVRVVWVGLGQGE